MSTKKKATPKPFEAKPKYNNRQIVHFITYHNGKPECLYEGEIVARKTREVNMQNSFGKAAGTIIAFSYSVDYSQGEKELMEAEIYPSFFEAAKVFAKSFLFLLK
jgi:hypothetical protein